MIERASCSTERTELATVLAWCPVEGLSLSQILCNSDTKSFVDGAAVQANKTSWCKERAKSKQVANQHTKSRASCTTYLNITQSNKDNVSLRV